MPFSRGVRGGHPWGGLFILHLLAFPFLRQSTFYIALTRTKRLRKEIKYRLIHNNALQSYVWSSISLNIHVSHFKNWLFLFVGSLYKSDSRISCFRNYGEMKVSKVHRTLYKWRVTWNYACIPFKYNYIVWKKYFKISLLPVNKRVS